MSTVSHFNLLTFLIKSIRYHRRLYTGLFLSVIVTSTIITGALLIGDSLRHTLRSLSQQRLGTSQLVMSTHDRFFKKDLAKRMEDVTHANATSAIRIRSLAINPDLSRRAHKVNVYGVEPEFWDFGKTDVPFLFQGDEVVINQKLADKLGVKSGNQILVRFEKPGLLSKDSVIASTENIIDARRFTISRILTAKEFGNFSLETNQLVPYNVFIPLELLQKNLNKNEQANVLIVGDHSGKSVTVDDAKSALNRVWRLHDLGLILKGYPQKGVVELRSDRVFIDNHIESVASKLTPNRKIFTYFVNEIRKGNSNSPYSMVAAVDTHSHENADPADDWSQFSLDENSIILNQWCADDLEAEIGDTITIRYLVPDKRETYKEAETSFILKSILPISNANIDKTLTPAYPGLVDSENCRDWDTGIPIALNRIRTKDETYWDKYRATPKAVISLTKGQEIWNNRFGNITAIRYPSSIDSKKDIETRLHNSINPTEIGFNFRSVQIDAANAATGSTDFSGLFIGLSFFIIIAALLLTGLLFAFSIEHKSEEQGILCSLGFQPFHIKVQYLIEAFLISVPAAFIGSSLGLGYTKLILHGLATLWRDAIVRTPLAFHADVISIIYGTISTIILTISVIYISLGRRLNLSVTSLLKRYTFDLNPLAESGKKRGVFPLFLSIISMVLALGFMWLASQRKIQESTGFFSAGILSLIAFLSFFQHFLMSLGASPQPEPNLKRIAIRNVTRHKRRSLAVITIFACASFLLISMEAQKLATSNSTNYDNPGTGGFTFIGEATHPIYDESGSLLNPEALSFNIIVYR